MVQIQYDKDLERVENPEPDTPERAEMADIIEEMWPANVQEIADNSDWSHGHARNTIESHFRYVDPKEDTVDSPEEPLKDEKFIEVRIPNDVEPEAYLRGLLDGMAQAERV